MTMHIHRVRVGRAVAGVALAAFLLVSAPSAGGETRRYRTRVAAAVPPVQYVAACVGGKYVEASTLVEPNELPGGLVAGEDQKQRLFRAMVYVRTGLPFEETLLRTVGGAHRGVFIDALQSIELRTLEDGTAKDPRIWLSPERLERLATNIANGLKEIHPDQAEEHDAFLASFLEQLARVRARLDAAFAPLRGKTVGVSAPVFGYLAERYGFEQVRTRPEARRVRLTEQVDPGAKEAAKPVLLLREAGKEAKPDGVPFGRAVVTVNLYATDVLGMLDGMARDVAAALEVDLDEAGAVE